jgi:hypothetical protein
VGEGSYRAGCVAMSILEESSIGMMVSIKVQ